MSGTQTGRADKAKADLRAALSSAGMPACTMRSTAMPAMAPMPAAAVSMGHALTGRERDESQHSRCRKGNFQRSPHRQSP